MQEGREGRRGIDFRYARSFSFPLSSQREVEEEMQHLLLFLPIRHPGRQAGRGDLSLSFQMKKQKDQGNRQKEKRKHRRRRKGKRRYFFFSPSPFSFSVRPLRPLLRAPREMNGEKIRRQQRSRRLRRRRRNVVFVPRRRRRYCVGFVLLVEESVI